MQEEEGGERGEETNPAGTRKSEGNHRDVAKEWYSGAALLYYFFDVVLRM